MNTINIALYALDQAPYTVSDTAYSSGAANQVGTSGTGYTTGGKTLENGTVANQTNVATLTFDTNVDISNFWCSLWSYI